VDALLATCAELCDGGGAAAARARCWRTSGSRRRRRGATAATCARGWACRAARRGEATARLRPRGRSAAPTAPCDFFSFVCGCQSVGRSLRLHSTCRVRRGCFFGLCCLPGTSAMRPTLHLVCRSCRVQYVCARWCRCCVVIPGNQMAVLGCHVDRPLEHMHEPCICSRSLFNGGPTKIAVLRSPQN